MNAFLNTPFRAALRSDPWLATAPVREELFGIERLEQHAQSLAAAQTVSARPLRVLSLQRRLKDNAQVLLVAYRASAAAVADGIAVVPAAQWLLDNYPLVEEHVRGVREDLPAGYYRQLPKLASGPFAGYPRVFGLAWAFVAHTDSFFDPATLQRFIDAYQKVQPLTIGELWAVAITLRIVLIENLRRLTDQITAAYLARLDAEALADRLFAAGCAQSALDDDIRSRSAEPLSELFAAQLAKRLRDKDPITTPALAWLAQRLHEQNSSVGQAVSHAQQRQGASNLSVRNVITSLRQISSLDWAQWFEDVSLVDARLRAGSRFAAMDFTTRNLYRSAIEQLARGSTFSELQIAEQALQLTSARPEQEREADPGHVLIAEGRPLLEAAIDFHPSVGLRWLRWQRQLGVGGYVGLLLALTAGLLAILVALLPAAPALWLTALVVLGALPASQLASALLNRAVTRSFGAIALPGLDMLEGVPSPWRSLVAVPTLLGSEADLLEDIEQLEVHYLSGNCGELYFALLVDGGDAAEQHRDDDRTLLEAGHAAVATLNRRHGPGEAGARFMLLHRERRYNPAQGCWMGWERKRGKLHELNRLLRGDAHTSFGEQTVPADVRLVITLDADTRLPRDAAQRLVGKLAHPLNRPRLSRDGRNVVTGYGILQPRVTPSLPLDAEGSLYQRVFSSPGGVDPYAAAVSDVYQDLFGEGSYTGKGIYDVDAFEAALDGRVPDDSMLSHDLFEGIYARAGLVSEIEVVEAFPARVDVAMRRQHRWTRGDWQLLPWLLKAQLPALGRWKIIDNLRRSLVAPATLGALLVAWWLPGPAAWIATLAVLACSALPAVLALLLAAPRKRPAVLWRSHGQRLTHDLRLASWQFVLDLAWLPDQAWSMVDAIFRSVYRVFHSKRLLLEWTTAAQAGAAPRPGLGAHARRMAPGLLLALAGCAVALAKAPGNAALIVPFALLWLTAPFIAQWVSRSSSITPCAPVNATQAQDLRLIARRTWRYFETFVTAGDNHLPPDNFQEQPHPVVAHRTSPTNMGLYLLAAASARDFGWAGTRQTLLRLEASLAVMQTLERFRGHFYNWYDTQDLRPLPPVYVSAVDSGNLAGHLIALANACEQWAEQGPLDPSSGLHDTLLLVIEEQGRSQPLTQIQAHLQTPFDLGRQAVARLLGEIPADPGNGVWLPAFKQAFAAHLDDRQLHGDTSARLRALADNARRMAMDMEFGFLLNRKRQLLSIGYRVAEQQLDSNCYDMLASEARLASLFAIAKGDVATRHWFRLGRSATPLGNGSALISWSGSMFEYLMPSLVMRAPAGSLLTQTQRLVVERQQAYGKSLGIPWGISESAYNARDLEFTYQYSNFGVPGLGLKRGLADDQVIAPYATALAAMVDAPGAWANFATLRALGAIGQYGFYEAVDYTPTRLPEETSQAIVCNYMAHHQGMTVVAIANVLLDGAMRERFHREPMIQASELLLQERMPANVAALQAAAEHGHNVAAETLEGRTQRALDGLPVAAPITHLLSNGRYCVMLTGLGTGYSRWRDLAVTRWREDPVLDPWGSFVFVRDLNRDTLWSAADTRAHGCLGEVTFAEDHAQFISHRDGLTSTLTVLVSGEDDSEVRSLTLTNRSEQTRSVELTTYSELVLGAASADSAHPAFAKLFVVTEYLPEYAALVATRRPRSSEEPQVWAAHFAVLDTPLDGPVQYESDRAAFLGREHTLLQATALKAGATLSNSVGTVLDPLFALRHCLSIAPGQSVDIAFWTVVADSREALLGLIDKHHEHSAYERAKTLAWTQAQVQLRHLDIDAEAAADFQRLSASLLYADAQWRAPALSILRGAGSQAGLWPMGISGDLPVVLLQIDDIEDLPQVRELLLAHEYWRMKRLSVDLVILNERDASYQQDLQIAVETAVRSSQSRPGPSAVLSRGTVYTLRADLLPGDARSLLLATARLVLRAHSGCINAQIGLRPSQGVPDRKAQWPQRATSVAATAGAPEAVEEVLECFNGLGGFADEGREYVTLLDRGACTPAPWLNVIANQNFGFQVSTQGAGYTWALNSRENQLTPWGNDPVGDASGEALYVRDNANGVITGPCAWPVRDEGRYSARHGFGYSRFEHSANQLHMGLLQYVPLEDAVKISRLSVRNLSDKPRRLSVFSYLEWVLGTSRAATAAGLISEVDARTGALLARNPCAIAFAGRVAFSDLAGGIGHWTADRTEFLGRHGSYAAPAALASSAPLAGASAAGLDPCAAQQHEVLLAAGQQIELVWLVGQAPSLEQAQRLVLKYRHEHLDGVLQRVRDSWADRLEAVQVRTPDRALDIMLNGWLLYQTIVCRLWARSAFYQASGAYGLRDQLQDGLALSLAAPHLTREHLLRAAGRQFVEGDLQHWWLPHSGQGVRTRISDDRAWLAYCTAEYVRSSGDEGVLDAPVAFLEGEPLVSGETDRFFLPQTAASSASLYEHCALALDCSLEQMGDMGLPLIGSGDWNDGMNRVGEQGRGQSVWLGWMLLASLERFIALAARRDCPRAQRWQQAYLQLQTALETHAWDGQWYRRATFDDGTWLGADGNQECRIDSIAQSWAVLSGAAQPERAQQAMSAVNEHLVRPADGIALLFTPPFEHSPHDPGYLMAYPPGLRENGGQYSHAAMWAILAFARQHRGDEALALIDLLNPINHALDAASVQRYKVEPYVIAADVYSVAPHVGRGGWTWYTGSASWMYRAGIEGILGVRREGQWLLLDPRIAARWAGFSVQVRVPGGHVHISVERSDDGGRGCLLDGKPLVLDEGVARIPLAPHLVHYTL
ncbi:glycosyl transferase [Pseudomonas sp. CFBP 8758]|uniref:GH36-type glycosyl hydrolase domain-containing protein n=1 Tax=Pseudomonas sp. CFBP 8758 TaxID=2775286 RepID=UPI00177D7F91|nr:glucoamylase family protein [Pseudomonas sp. CFBP 8758]MBD8595559.1 glycosyl transferase [Pseudomonas sp. CFBP 8758]